MSGATTRSELIFDANATLCLGEPTDKRRFEIVVRGAIVTSTAICQLSTDTAIVTLRNDDPQSPSGRVDILVTMQKNQADPRWTVFLAQVIREEGNSFDFGSIPLSVTDHSTGEMKLFVLVGGELGTTVEDSTAFRNP